jgi:transcriptional regulator GlxA family with amidase domain
LAYSKEETQLSTLEYKEPVRSDNRLGEVFVYIEKYYLNNKEPLGLDDLAVVANMSRATLGRHFKTVTSQNVVDFINNKRVRKASELLITTSLGVDEIGRKCGFGSYANFNDQFKEIAGYSPREYRNRHPSRKE